MADDVTVSSSANFIAATDDVGGRHAQLIKVLEGDDGSRVRLDKNEDDPHASGDGGWQLLAVRKDTATILCDADGDYVPLIVDNAGRLHVTISGQTLGAGRTPLQAPIDVSASGDNTVVAAVAGQKIYVVAYDLIAAAAVTLRWKSGGATNRSGPMPLAANSGLGRSSVPHWPLFWTDAATALTLNLSAAVAVGGTLTYFTSA